jgi:hypothetical protein
MSNNRSESLQQCWQAVWNSLFVAGTVFFVMSDIYFRNFGEIAGSFGRLAMLGAAFAIAGFVVLLGVQCLVFRTRFFGSLSLLIFLGGLILWLQSYIFYWNFGLMDGSTIDWREFRLCAWFEIVFFVLLVGVVMGLRKKLQPRLLTTLAIIFFTIQLASAFSSFMANKDALIGGADQEPTVKKFRAEYGGMLRFSGRQNVIVVILDMFGQKLFTTALAERPELAPSFKDFTLFENMLTPVPGTVDNIPQILTGPHAIKPFGSFSSRTSEYIDFIRRAYQSEGSLPRKLRSLGYSSEAYSRVPMTIHWSRDLFDNITPIGAGDKAPHAEKASFFTLDGATLNGWAELCFLQAFRSLPTFAREWVFENHDFVTSEVKRRTVKVFPVKTDKRMAESFEGWATHREFDELFLDNLQKELRAPTTSSPTNDDRPAFKFFHLAGAHYPYWIDEHFRRMNSHAATAEIQQGIGYLKMMGMFLDLLKRQGVYDDAVIVIMADHGSSRSSSIYALSDPSQAFRPLFLLKPLKAKQDTMRRRAEPGFIWEVRPTIMEAIGVDPGSMGVSLFNIAPDELAARDKEWDARFLAEGEPSCAPQNPEVVDLKALSLERASGGEQGDIHTNRHRVRFLLFGDLPRPTQDRKLLLKRLGDERKALTVNLAVSSELKQKFNWWYSAACLKGDALPDGQYFVSDLEPKEGRRFLERPWALRLQVTQGVAKIVH